METKKIKFDLNRINEENIKVVTRGGRNVRILCTDAKGVFPIVGLIDDPIRDSEGVCRWGIDGRYYTDIEDGECGADLMLEIQIKPRRMTNRELSWWLRDCPEEHREWKLGKIIDDSYCYEEILQDNECLETILVRRNGGAWEKPFLIEE